MKENIDVPIAERIKAFVSLTAAAAGLDVSRPTFYKWMAKYDEGCRQDIPRSLLEFFDFVSEDVTVQEVNRYLAIEGYIGGSDSESEPKGCAHVIEMDHSKISETEISDLYSDFRKMKSEINNLNLFNIREAKGGKQNQKSVELLSPLNKNFLDKKSKLNPSPYFEVGSVEKPEKGWIRGAIDSIPVVAGSRMMVLFRDAAPRALNTRVEVFVRVGVEYDPVGTYLPAEEQHHCTIEDLLPGPDYYYKITQYISGGDVSSEIIPFRQ